MSDATAPGGEPPRREAPPAGAPVPVPPLPEPGATGDETVLPGVHRGGFHRLPTAPVGVASAQVTGPAEPGVHDTDTGELLPVWMPPPRPAAPQRGVAGWALAFAIVGLGVSLFVGWGFPIALVGIVTGIVALRRPLESRAIAWWAIALGTVSVLYSAGWLVWAATRTNLFG